MAAGSSNGRKLHSRGRIGGVPGNGHSRGRIRGVPGNGRPRARRMAAGTLGAALIGAGPTGLAVASAPAASAAAASAAAPAAAAAAAAAASAGPHAAAADAPQGYRLIGADGGVFNYKTNFYGSMSGQSMEAPVVGGASMPDGSGYWLVGSDGGVFAFGRAGFYGSLWGIKLRAPIVGIAPTADGRGYWLVGKDGGIFAFGDAGFEGSLVHIKLGGPAVGIAGDTVDNTGYWVVAADGGVFALGHARFHGSAVHAPLRGPITGISAAPGGGGYWLSGIDGGVFTYGVGFYGSRGTSPRPFNTVGILGTPSGHGYWLATSDGTVYPFGDAVNLGSLSGQHLAAPIVGITGRAGGPTFTASYPRPLWVGVTTDTSQGGVGGDDTPTFSHGTAPYKAALVAGTHLPPGLLLESDGTLRGDPAAPAEFTVVFTDAKGNQTNVPVSVGYAPTGYIASLAGGPVAAATPLARSAKPNVSVQGGYGQTTLPAPDAQTVAQGPGTTYPNPDPDPNPDGDGDSGASTGSQVSTPSAVAAGPDGTVYFAEGETAFGEGIGGGPGLIRDITPDGIVHYFAGGGSTAPSSDGTALSDASFSDPTYLAVDNAGDVIIGDSVAKQIYVVPAKDGTYYDTDMTAGKVWSIDASIGSLAGMAVAPDGTLYWSDSSQNRIERFAVGDASPTTVVDQQTHAADDGSETLGTPWALAVDPGDGTLVMANACGTDCNNAMVVEELTGSGQSAQLVDIARGGQWDVAGLTVDTSHNVYVSDDFGVSGTGAKTYDDLILRIASGPGTAQDKVKVVAGQSPTLQTNPQSGIAPYDSTYQNGVVATDSGIDVPNGLAYDATAKILLIGQSAQPGAGGVAAKAVRIVSHPDQATGTAYTPGPVASPT